jgi:predicted transcriptional regulator
MKNVLLPQVRVHPDLRAWLDSEAERTGHSLSTVIRDAIREASTKKVKK